MGANGAGKSTLVKILSGTLQPDAGPGRSCGQAGVDRLAAGRTRARHRDRPPADQPGRRAGTDGRREPDPRRIVLGRFAGLPDAACHPPAGGRDRRGTRPRPAARPRLHGVAPGRAPADRHCPRRRGEIVGADPRRADLDAVGRRGRAAVRHPRTAARLGHRHPLHLAPAGRPAAHRRPRRRAARRPRGRRICEADRFPGGGRRDDRPLAGGGVAGRQWSIRCGGRIVVERRAADPAGSAVRSRHQAWRGRRHHRRAWLRQEPAAARPLRP